MLRKSYNVSKEQYKLFYNRWFTMKARCLNPSRSEYKSYGGRGITVCDDWLDFETYVADIERVCGPRPSEKHTIDRINNDDGYHPGNVRWADRKIQNLNRRPPSTTTSGLSHDDIRAIRQDNRALSEIAEQYGVSNVCIWYIRQKLYWKHVV